MRTLIHYGGEFHIKGGEFWLNWLHRILSKTGFYKGTNKPKRSFRSLTNVRSSRQSLLSVMADFIEWARKYSFCFCFRQEIVRNIISYNFFFKYLVELASENSGPDILFWGKFLITYSISFFHFSIYRCFSL